jgi:hypothetical protein
MADAKRDENRVPTLLGVSSTDGTTPLKAEITAATGRLRVDSLLTAGTAITGKVYITDGTNDVDVLSYENENSLKVVFGHAQHNSIHLDAENVQTTTGYVLVDLSDTVNFPHTATTEIDVKWITINVNPDTSFAGEIEIGFLTDVDADNGDFNVLHTWHLERTQAQINQHIDLSSSHLEGSTDHWFGPTAANDTTWQTDTALVRPDGGTVAPNNGDLVMKITRTGGAIDVGITVGYQTA